MCSICKKSSKGQHTVALATYYEAQARLTPVSIKYTSWHVRSLTMLTTRLSLIISLTAYSVVEGDLLSNIKANRECCGNVLPDEGSSSTFPLWSLCAGWWQHWLVWKSIWFPHVIQKGTTQELYIYGWRKDQETPQQLSCHILVKAFASAQMYSEGCVCSTRISWLNSD